MVKKPLTERERLESKLKEYQAAKKQHEALMFINDGAIQAIENLLKELKDDSKTDSKTGS